MFEVWMIWAGGGAALGYFAAVYVVFQQRQINALIDHVSKLEKREEPPA